MDAAPDPIDTAAREIAQAVEPYLVARPVPPARLDLCIASVIRRHLERLPVAQPATHEPRPGYEPQPAAGRADHPQGAF